MGMFDWWYGNPKHKSLPPEGMPSWPNAKDAQMMADSGIGYGTGNDAYTEGLAARRLSPQMVDPKNASLIMYLGNSGNDPRTMDKNGIVSAEPSRTEHQAYVSAQNAANRSAVTGLGHNPRQFNIDAEESARKTNLGGKYDPKADFGMATTNIDSNRGTPGGTLAHEATHRGFKTLRDDPEAEKLVTKYMHPSSEERMVRALNLATSGLQPAEHDPSIEADAKKFASMTPDERAKAVERLKGSVFSVTNPDRMALIEALAADAIAKKRPRGPR